MYPLREKRVHLFFTINRTKKIILPEKMRKFAVSKIREFYGKQQKYNNQGSTCQQSEEC